jgi:hypothetical protein
MSVGFLSIEKGFMLVNILVKFTNY